MKITDFSHDHIAEAKFAKGVCATVKEYECAATFE